MNDYIIENARQLIAKRFETETQQINSALLEELELCFKDDQQFDPTHFFKFPAEVILDYLYNTHHYYINYRLPGIQQTINLMLFQEEEIDKDLMMMKIFFEAYQSNLNYHIREEEEKFFPLIREIAATEKSDYALVKDRVEAAFDLFIDSHADEESILERMLILLNEYKPSRQNKNLYIRLCSQLEFFVKDLKIHAKIEEEVLFPVFLKRVEKIKPSA